MSNIILKSLIMDFSKYQELIESTIDLKQVEKNHTFLINSNFYPELKDLRDKLDEMEDKIEQIANKVNLILKKEFPILTRY